MYVPICLLIAIAVSLALMNIRCSKWLRLKYMRLRQCFRDTNNPYAIFSAVVLVVFLINLVAWLICG